MNAVYFLLALAAGAALASQVAINSRLKAAVGRPMQATLISLGVGAAAGFAYTLAAREPWPKPASLAEAPWWAWCGGQLGVFYLWATVVSSPRLGWRRRSGWSSPGR